MMTLKMLLIITTWNNQVWAIDFFNKLYLKIEKIKISPEVYAIRYEDVRFAKIDHFPFIIHFINQPDAIVIIGILHTSRNPQRWKERKQ